ncbi:hypothetical protein AALP_AA6G012700 [Arabis alpina]|uniref:Uncharacterized protein n=1 Tax=Arabis alpina TaxID=50452 RepID=A0A087GLB9_ARAAL|nr:hypothetical protein AALP_AA6G012700 [Arabis alpina]
MDTLSASVSSSFNLPSLPPQPQPPLKSISHLFKRTTNATATASSASTNLSKPTSSSPASYSQHNLSGISFQAKPSRASSPVHEKAASGFAAALVSVCQSKNCLGRTQEDVRRLIEFLVGEEKKRNNNGLLGNNFVVVERGKFGKHLKGLVKMLITRGKSGILFDVLMEFERICNELVLVRSTKPVMVSLV